MDKEDNGDALHMKEVGSNSIAVLTFGRFQPPHIGHEVLVRKVYDEAQRVGGDSYVFVSRTKNVNDDVTKFHLREAKKEAKSASELERDTRVLQNIKHKCLENPLSVSDKIKIMRVQYNNLPEIKLINTEICWDTTMEDNMSYMQKEEFEDCRDLGRAIHKLTRMNYSKLIFVFGSDRMPVFRKLSGIVLDKINATRQETGLAILEYDFVNLERDESAENVSGMSASKMRRAAIENDVDFFINGIVPVQNTSVRDTLTEMVPEIMNQIRQGCGVNDTPSVVAVMPNTVAIPELVMENDTGEPMTKRVRRSTRNLRGGGGEKHKGHNVYYKSMKYRLTRKHKSRSTKRTKNIKRKTRTIRKKRKTIKKNKQRKF